MTRQYPLPLPVAAQMTEATFFPSPANALARAVIGADDGWPGERMLILGPPGSGKTHLATIWATGQGAVMLRPGDLTQAPPGDLAQGRAVALDDADQVAGQPAREEALFHLHNHLAQAGARFLLTARAPPRDWGLALPDLASRMQAVAQTRLDAPDDALLQAVLVKQFADRQIAVQPTLIAYLLPRMDRSLAGARDLVAALDARALARGGPVTRALAAEVLASQSQAAEALDSPAPAVQDARPPS